MADALGFIETKGLVGAVAAADAMVKSADVTLVGKEITGPALVLIKIKGDFASVKYAVEAGEIAAKNAGNFISSLVIADPDSRLAAMLPEISIDISPDIIQKEETLKEPETVEEKLTSISEFNPPVTYDNVVFKNKTEDESIEVIAGNYSEINNLPEEAKVDSELINTLETSSDVNQKSPAEIKKRTRKTGKKIKQNDGADTTKEPVNEIKSKPVEVIPIVDEYKSEYNDAPIKEEILAPAIEPDEQAQENAPVIDEQGIISKVETTKKGKKSKPKLQEVHATLFDSLFDSIENDTENENLMSEPVFNSTIERLKNEALGNKYEVANPPTLIVDEVAPIVEITEFDNETETPDPAPVKEQKTNGPIEQKRKIKNNNKVNADQENKKNASTAEEISSELSIDYLEKLNVHLLRKAARGTSGFPIQGREISKANRQVLLDYFNQLL